MTPCFEKYVIRGNIDGDQVVSLYSMIRICFAFLQLFSRSLKRVTPNWEIREAANGETALRLVETEEFDLIFMDQ